MSRNGACIVNSKFFLLSGILDVPEYSDSGKSWFLGSQIVPPSCVAGESGSDLGHLLQSTATVTVDWIANLLDLRAVQLIRKVWGAS